MSLSGLKSALLDAVNGETDSLQAFNALAQALNDYIQTNLIVKGTFAGVNTVPPFNPDPTTSVQYEVLSVGILGPALMSGAAGGLSGFQSILSTQLLTVMVNPITDTNVPPVVLPAPVPILALPVTIDMSGKPDNISAAYDQLASAIDASIVHMGSTPTPIPGALHAPTFSGVVTLTEQQWK